MPTMVIAAAIGAGIAGGVAVALGTGAFMATFGTAFLTGVVMGGLSRAFTKKPKNDSPTVQAQGRVMTTRQAISPWEVVLGEARKGGVLTFRYISADRQFWHMVITLACHQSQAVDTIYANDEIVPLDGNGDATGKYAGYIRVKVSLGGEASTAQPFPDLVAESNGRWTNDHKQYGHTKIYVRLKANPDLFPSGVPNFSVVMRGALAYDNRSAATAYTNNVATLISHYLTEDTWGYGLGADFATEIDADDYASAANSSDEAVPLAAGGTEPRYRANGTFLMSETPKTVLTRLLSACAGTLVNLGDKWHISVGVYNAPTVTLTESHLAGPSVVQAHVDDRESCNGVRGIFTNPNAHWQPDDFPALASATYLAEDGGERRWKDIDLTAFVTSITQAQRLAKIELLKARQALTEAATFKLSAWGVVPGRTVARTDTQLGWSAKAFEVMESELAIVEEDDNVTIQVKHLLRETAAAVYDWSTSEEQAEDIAPNTSLPDPGVVPAPGQPAITEALYETRDGRGVAAKAILTFAQSSYPFGASYQAEYKSTSVSAYTVLPLVKVASGSTGDVVVEILDIAAGRYDFRAKAIGLGGASSDYATSLDKEIRALGAEPAALTGLSIQAGGGTARLKFDQHPELDVRRGGRILVRFCHEGVTPAWESAFSIGEVAGWPGDSTQIDVPLKPGTYLLKPRDSSGHECSTWTEIATRQASVLTFTTLSTVTFDAAFAGTHSGTAAPDGSLTLGGVGLFDDIPDFDAVTDLDGYGGIATSGTWTADTGMDLGSVKNVRLTSRLEGAVDNLLNQIDDRAGNVDDWIDWDGASFGGSSADAWLESRETDDDPTGAPVWKDWKRLDAAEFRARAFQFRARLTSSDPAYRPLVSVLRATAEVI